MPALATIPVTRQAKFRDGRRLAFCQSGDPNGRPVFFLHGFPGTRLFRHPDDALTASLGIRLITIDRPGFGLSDGAPGRTLLDWAADVSALADVLNIERFAVAGHSAGGAYAAACAYKMPHRLTKTAIVAGFPPLSDPHELAQLALPLRRIYRMAQHVPRCVKLLLRVVWWLNGRCGQQRFIRGFLKSMPAPDRAIFNAPEFMEMLAANVEELQVSGSDGYAEELSLLARPWGFRLHDITAPVDLWWGEAETHLPVQIAHNMARELPQASLHIVPGAAHYVILSHWQTILSTLIE